MAPDRANLRKAQQIQRRQVKGEPCVWCGGGLCHDGASNRCEPYDYALHGVGREGSEGRGGFWAEAMRADEHMLECLQDGSPEFWSHKDEQDGREPCNLKPQIHQVLVRSARLLGFAAFGQGFSSEGVPLVPRSCRASLAVSGVCRRRLLRPCLPHQVQLLGQVSVRRRLEWERNEEKVLWFGTTSVERPPTMFFAVDVSS